MIIVKGGVTVPMGFLANGIKAGIKPSGRPDLAMLYSEVPAVAAGMFTSNNFKASPVKISMAALRNKTHQAVIVNAGNANCANGKRGDRDAIAMARLTAAGTLMKDKEVLVASTGIIGHPLPMGKIKARMHDLIGGLSRSGGENFAKSIMTTDTVKKEIAVKVKLGRTVISIGGACKGVGMIHPELKAAPHATMLCFIATDAAISKNMLQAALSQAVEESLNMVSVDGDMSTNDSCFVMANGLAGNARIVSRTGGYKAFALALKFVCSELAKMMAADGEGATKLVEIKIEGAKTKDDAARIARKISISNLLKCAVYGEDPNWGRVAAAAGASGVKFDPNKVDIYIGPLKVLSNGSSMKSFDKGRARKYFKGKQVNIKVDLKSGHAGAVAWTCDFSKEYVTINSEYST